MYRALLLLFVLAGALAGCGINPTREIPPQPPTDETWGILSTLKSRPMCIGSRIVYYDVSRVVEFLEKNPGKNFFFTKEFPVLSSPSQEVVDTSRAWVLALGQKIREAGHNVVPACGEETIRADLEFAEYMRQDRARIILFGRIILIVKGKRVLLTRDDLFAQGEIKGRIRPITLAETLDRVEELARLNVQDMGQVLEVVRSRALANKAAATK